MMLPKPVSELPRNWRAFFPFLSFYLTLPIHTKSVKGASVARKLLLTVSREMHCRLVASGGLFKWFMYELHNCATTQGVFCVFKEHKSERQLSCLSVPCLAVSKMKNNNKPICWYQSAGCHCVYYSFKCEVVSQLNCTVLKQICQVS